MIPPFPMMACSGVDLGMDFVKQSTRDVAGSEFTNSPQFRQFQAQL